MIEPIPEEAWPTILATLGLSNKKRSAEVLRHLLACRSDRAIARLMGIAVNTVRTHVSRLCAQLRVSGRMQLAVKVLALYSQFLSGGGGRHHNTVAEMMIDQAEGGCTV